MLGKDQSISNGSSVTSARTVRRQNDNKHFIERFAALTGFHVHSATTDALPREFLARPVSEPNVLIQQYGYQLERRTTNALCRYEPIRPLECWTYGRLLEIRGFGVFSLLDLLEVLAKHDVSNNG